MLKQHYPMQICKQELADAVKSALSNRAERIEVVVEDNICTYYAYFSGSEKEIRQRESVANAAINELRHLDVFTSRPTVKVSQNILSIRFAHATDLTQTEFENLPGFCLGRTSIRKKDGKVTGPWPVEHNPLMPSLKRNAPQTARHKKKHNQRKPQDKITDHVVVEPEPQFFNYDEFDWDQATNADAMTVLHGSLGLSDNIYEEPRVHTKRESAPSKTVSTLNPNDVQGISGKFLFSIGRQLSRNGVTTSRKTRTAYSQWCHLMAALGLVTQTEVYGSLDRLQNDRNTHPCSLTWIHHVLSGKKQDPSIKVNRNQWFGQITKTTTRKDVQKWTVTMPVNGERVRIYQANSQVEQAFHSAAKGQSAKAATICVSKEGHYHGLVWN
jgi:hypothetical protein